MHTTGPDRVLRGAAAATVATAVALCGHMGAGAPAPGWLGLALPWWLSITLCTVLVGRSLSLTRLSLAVLGSQLAFHALFIMGSPAMPLAMTGPGYQHGVHDHSAHLSGLAADPAGLGGGAVHAHAAHGGGAEHLAHLSHAAHLTPGMLAGHLLAAALTVALLYRGELLVRRALGLALRILAGLAHLVAGHLPQQTLVASVRTTATPLWRVPVARRPRILAGPDVGRAPPCPLGV